MVEIYWKSEYQCRVREQIYILQITCNKRDLIYNDKYILVDT